MVFDKLKRNSSGISSVLGELLITGVFVISLGSLFVVVNSIDAPVDSAHLVVEEWIDVPSDIVYLRHVGGETIDTKDLKINVNIGGTNYMYYPDNISENLGGKSFWELSDVIEINTNKEWGISIPDENDVTVKLINSESREILNPKYRVRFLPVPSPSIDFDIAEKSVVPQGAFISSFKVLGAAIQSSGHDLKVTTQLKVGNETFEPWGDYNLAVTGNVNDNTTHSWNLPATYPAGTPVSISGKSWTFYSNKYDSILNEDWHPLYEIKSSTNSNCVKVLRNGDDVP